MKRDQSIILAIASLVIMFILYGLSAAGLLGDNPVGQTANYVNPLIIPSGYAFSIWGIIYTGLLIFPFYQWRKGNRSSHLWKKVRSYFSANVILNGLWLAFASYNWLILSVIVIVAMLFTLFKINELLIQIKQDGEPLNYWTERLVFSLYFAWITLATVLNVSSALAFYKWDGFGISELNWSYIILPILAVIGIAVLKKYRDIAYAGVVVWAFLALVVRHWGVLPMISYLAVGIALIFSGAMIYLLQSRSVSEN